MKNIIIKLISRIGRCLIERLTRKFKHTPMVLSPATMQLARNRLKQFERQSDRGFLIRADINRRMHSLG